LIPLLVELGIAGVGSDRKSGGFRDTSLELLFDGGDMVLVDDELDSLVLELALDGVNVADDVTDGVECRTTELVFDAASVDNDDVDEFEGLRLPCEA
jgi:hypothetical protein